MKGSLLGPSYSRETIRRFLEERGVPCHEHDDDALPVEVASLLADEKVVG